jgi:hypothetical protein
MDDNIDDRTIHWSTQLEDLIAQEGEKCRGLAWIHQKAEALAGKKNNYIQIPAILFSTLAGVGSVGSSSLFGETDTARAVAPIVIGFVSLSVGVLNTLGNYFAYARKQEAHHIAYLHYSKLFTWVSVELALPRHERMNPAEMLSQLRDEMERLAETTPTPPEHILTDFTARFKDYKDVSKPAETNGLAKIMIYRENPMRSAVQTPSVMEVRLPVPPPAIRTETLGVE